MAHAEDEIYARPIGKLVIADKDEGVTESSNNKESFNFGNYSRSTIYYGGRVRDVSNSVNVKVVASNNEITFDNKDQNNETFGDVESVEIYGGYVETKNGSAETNNNTVNLYNIDYTDNPENIFIRCAEMNGKTNEHDASYSGSRAFTANNNKINVDNVKVSYKIGKNVSLTAVNISLASSEKVTNVQNNQIKLTNSIFGTLTINGYFSFADSYDNSNNKYLFDISNNSILIDSTTATAAGTGGTINGTLMQMRYMDATKNSDARIEIKNNTIEIKNSTINSLKNDVVGINLTYVPKELEDNFIIENNTIKLINSTVSSGVFGTLLANDSYSLKPKNSTNSVIYAEGLNNVGYIGAFENLHLAAGEVNLSSANEIDGSKAILNITGHIGNQYKNSIASSGNTDISFNGRTMTLSFVDGFAPSSGIINLIHIDDENTEYPLVLHKGFEVTHEDTFIKTRIAVI